MNRTFLMLAALGLGGCDLSGEFLFPRPVDGIPSVVDLGEITPFSFGDVTDIAARRQLIEDNTIYFEIGPSGSALFSGLSFTFQGTNNSVCLFVDPESVSWNQAIDPAGGSPYSFPDNPFDDADLDLDAGQTIYYTGTPGETMGNFELRYEDQLGNVVPLSASLCTAESSVRDGVQESGGAGFPEQCTVQNTVAGISYTAVIEAFNFPIDDSRISGGLVVFDGPCNNMLLDAWRDLENGVEIVQEECVIRGEALVPNAPGVTGDNASAAGLPTQTWLGLSEAPTWEGYIDFELAYCQEDARRSCRQERNAVAEAGLQCSWEKGPGLDEEGFTHCFCGDENDTPRPGAF